MNVTLSELRDLIRVEADIAGDDTNQVFIDAVIGQELRRLTGLGKYEELRASEDYVTTLARENTFTLPEDYQFVESISYKKSGTVDEPQLVLAHGKNPCATTNLNGTPRFYYRNGNNFIVYPYLDVPIGDTFTLNYFRHNPMIVNTDELLVPSLEKPLQLACVARLLKMKDSRKGQLAASDADQAWKDSRVQAAGN